MTKKGNGNGNSQADSSGNSGSDLPNDDDQSDDVIDGGNPGDGDHLPWMDAGESDEAQAAQEETTRAVLRLAVAASKGEQAINEVRRSEPDLIKRARALFALQAFRFPDEKAIRSGDNFVMQALPTDTNRWEAFDVLFGDGDDRPHVDTFRGRLVDHRGEIIDERYPMIELVGALAAAGLKGQSADQTRKAFKEWALGVQSNDLIKRVDTTIPQWDGVPRMETALIELFETFDTDLNREFSRYFWLSIYARIFYPGCFAPIVLSLFGAQNSGKSFMAKLICQEVTGKKDADSVQLDLSGDKMEFLREITGNSIVANVGEMTGFNRGDLNKIKDFITRTGDNMHYKYEGHFTQPRQWVTVMDGNKYDGLQRDETGNRRFYPMFVAQLPDKHGQPDWKEEYVVDFTGFREKVWALLAEARAWFDAHGLKEYEVFAGVVSRQVAAFSRNEMARDRGTIKDEALDVFLIPALRKCPVTVLTRPKNKGVWIAADDISSKIALVSRNRCDVKFNHLPPKMALLGAEKVQINNTQGYLFRDVMTHDAYMKNLNGEVDADDLPSEAEVVIIPDSDEGF